MTALDQIVLAAREGPERPQDIPIGMAALAEEIGTEGCLLGHVLANGPLLANGLAGRRFRSPRWPPSP